MDQHKYAIRNKIRGQYIVVNDFDKLIAEMEKTKFMKKTDITKTGV